MAGGEDAADRGDARGGVIVVYDRTVKNSARVALLCILAASVSGCSSPGTLVARQTPGDVPHLDKATQDGVYGLFISGEDDPIFRTLIRAGDSLGFTVAAVSSVGSLRVSYLYAVYGENRFRLDPDKTYDWRWLSAPKATTITK
jgi:hypothetical protein